MSKSTTGFTIVELIIVVAVIAILATLTLVTYRSVTNETYLTGAKADVDNARKQAEAYKAANRSYPVSITDCPNPAAANICVKTDNNTLAYSVMDSSGDSTIAVGSKRVNQGYYESLAEKSATGTVQYADFAPIINLLGLKTYKLTFSIKSTGTSVTVRFVTSPGSKYGGLNQAVSVTSSYVTNTVTFTATNQSALTTAAIEFVPSNVSDTISVDNVSLRLN